MPVSKATRVSIHTYALDRYSANGDISIGSKVLSELINDMILLEARETRLRAALEAVVYFWERDPEAFGDEASVTSMAGKFAAVANQCRAALAGEGEKDDERG